MPNLRYRRCWQCFSNIFNRLALEKGLARISFIPLAKYVMISLLVVLEVILIMGVMASNWRICVVAETPSSLGITIS